MHLAIKDKMYEDFFIVDAETVTFFWLYYILMTYDGLLWVNVYEIL